MKLSKEILDHNCACEPENCCCTTPEFWDCECETNYIHHETRDICDECGAYRLDQPNSRIKELEGF